MPDRTYEVKISTPYDSAGAKASQADLDALAQKATALAASADGAGVSTGRIVDAAGRLREANGRFVEMGQSVDQVRQHLSNAEHEADHFLSSLKQGINIDIGHRLVENTVAKVENAAVPGVGAGTAAMAGGGAAATVGTVVAGAVIGTSIGYGMHQNAVNQEGLADQATGEESGKGTDHLTALRNAIAAAVKPEEQQKLREQLVQYIADQTKARDDLKTSIGDNNPTGSQIGAAAMAGGSGAQMQLGDPHAADRLTAFDVSLKLATGTLDRFASLAGSDPADDPRSKRNAASLEKYHSSDQYKYEQAELAGDQKGMDAYGFEKEVAAIKKKLMAAPFNLPEALARTEAEAQALAKDLAKQRKGLSTELDRVNGQTEKTKDPGSIQVDLDAKMRDLTATVPANLQGAATSGDLGAVAAGVSAMPTGTQTEIDQKTKLVELLKQIVALRHDEEAAQRKEDAGQKRDGHDAKATADAQKAHDDTLAAEKEEIAILQARANGNEAEARQLERKRDIQREITRLMKENLSYAEAQPIAEQRVNLQDDAKDKKKDDAAARRENAHHHHGEHAADNRKPAPIQGYHASPLDAGYNGPLARGRGRSGTAERELAKWKAAAKTMRIGTEEVLSRRLNMFRPFLNN